MPETLLVASAVLDCGAIAGIGWLLKRSARERDTTRAALAHLRDGVAQLVRDAEERTRGLAAALDARERRLRALIAETGRADPAEARLLRDLERAADDPLGLVPRLGDDGLKVPNGRADKPVGSRQAAVRGSSDEGQ